MGNSEPSLVPEWLRSSASGTGSGGACHQFSSSQSDNSLLPQPKGNKPSTSIGGSALHTTLDWRSPSNNGRSLSSNGPAKHDRSQYSRSYSSFSRSQRDRDRGRVKTDDRWDADYSDPLRSVVTGTTEKDTLRRSQSMASRNQTERRDYSDVRRARQNNSHGKGNGLVSSGTKEKVAFERDFPLLRPEDKPDITRVPSPGLSSSMQSLSMANLTLIGGEGWTSALVEVPVVVGGSTVATASNQSAMASSGSVASSVTTGLNMAEALVQAPSKSNAAQQPSMQNQKREELAVLQSMRLIPMTPSTPKNTTLNPCDKLKAKTVVRSVDQLPSLQQPARVANLKSDATKASHTGKMLVLKPGRENGVAVSVHDHTTANNTKQTVNVKLSSSIMSPGSIKDDKKPSLAQAQSRSDFFKLMRKKSMSSSSSPQVEVEPSSVAVGEKSVELEKSPLKKSDNGENESSENSYGDNSAVFPTEEEINAFMRSLGWEENAGDDEGLTEEEINTFYKEYMKLKPASKLCRSMQLAACSGGPSSDFGSSDSSA